MCPYKKSLFTYLMILVSIKVHILRKSGNLFNDPHINVPILNMSGYLFNNPHINVPILKNSGNLFNDPRIKTSTYKKKVWKLI